MTLEEKNAIIGTKKIITGNSPIAYTVKEIWEHKEFTLCSFNETSIVCNVEILKNP